MLSLNRFSLFQKCSVKKLTPALWNNTTRTLLKRATGSTAVGKFRQYRRQGRNRWARVPSGTSLYWDNAGQRHLRPLPPFWMERRHWGRGWRNWWFSKPPFYWQTTFYIQTLGDEFIFSFEAVILRELVTSFLSRYDNCKYTTQEIPEESRLCLGSFIRYCSAHRFNTSSEFIETKK